MPGIALPGWSTLKGNVKTILAAIAAEEKAADAAREFLVSRDRWQVWIEKQQNLAMVNVLVEGARPARHGSGARFHKQFSVTVNLDMYVLGTYEEQAVGGVTTLTPADEVAALRLDLLTAQVLTSILRMDNQNLGFAAGAIGAMENLTLTIWSQENQEATGQYAPARWSFDVVMPFAPSEGPGLPDMTELNLTFKKLLEDWSIKYTYPL